MATALHLIRARDCAEEAWRNGAGRTRTLWSGAGARISVATLEDDAPFSAYPGVDRTFCLLGPLAATLIVDASALRAVDSAAVAVLLECRRMARGWSKGFEIQGAPAKLRELAQLYGVEELLPLGPPAT